MEMFVTVNIALENAEPSIYLPGDVNGDGQITVDEIVDAVGAALDGCLPRKGAAARS